MADAEEMDQCKVDAGRQSMAVLRYATLLVDLDMHPEP